MHRQVTIAAVCAALFVVLPAVMIGLGIVRSIELRPHHYDSAAVAQIIAESRQ